MKIEVLGININFSIKVKENNTKQNEVKKPIKIEEDKPKNTHISDNWIEWWP